MRKYHELYKIELYKSITPEAFVDIEETKLKLKGLDTMNFAIHLPILLE